MAPAIERPFEASRFAYRTDMDGLTAFDPNIEALFEDVKKRYQSALERFESADEEARERYHRDKEYGLTIDTFGNWVVQNYPPWGSARAEAQEQGTNLTHAGIAAFGNAFSVKVKQ